MTLQSLLRLPLILSLILSPLQGWAANGFVTIDVSGKHGEHDAHGQSYTSAAGQRGDGRGAPGANGGDAVENPNKNGQDAGELFINLSFDIPSGSINTNVRTNAPGSSKPGQYRDTHKLAPGLAFDLRARGGRGGNGGNGGRGQDGGQGADGANAYHIGHTPFRGEDGKDGGRGGDEGDSTSGGHAGNGGKAEVELGIKDADLAMLVGNVDVRGNKGGDRGRGQGAGRGGKGGDGGSSDSISWQEETGRKTAYRTVEEKNSEGEVVSSYQEAYDDGPEYTTRTSYAPGGSDGDNGSDGDQSRKSVSDGRDSKDGKFTYTVIDEKGQKKSYPGFYNLILADDYTLKGDLNNNGFFEPGETIRVKNIKVTNNGLAPTPKYQKIKLYITDNSNWIRSKQVELTIPEVLEPGESHVFKKEDLAFYLAEKPRTEPGQLKSSDTLAPNSRVTRVERDFRNFNNNAQRAFQIQYPVKITPLTALDTLGPGEFMKVLFQVTNESEQTIGHLDGKDFRLAHTEIKRAGGSSEADQFVLLANEMEKFVDSKKGIAKSVSGLKPGESIVVEAIVGLGNNPTPYSDVMVQPELYLQSILDPKNVNRIQFEPFKLRVAQTFRHTENADVLLIANNHLNEKVLEALKYSASVKNLVMDIWDFSYYGFFNLHKSIAGYDSLFKAYANKTIIVLGNKLETPAGSENVTNLLSPDEIIAAARRHGIRFVILDTNGQAQDQVARLTTPEAISEQTSLDAIGLNEYSSVKSYVKELQAEVKRFDEEINGDMSQDLGVSEMKITANYLWGKPVEKDLSDRGADLLRRARAKVPEASLFIETNFNAQKKGGFLFKEWELGSLRVRRSVDLSRTSVLAMNIPAADLQRPDFVMSDEFQAALDISLHLDTKLKLIASILSGKFAEMKVPKEYAHLAKRKPMEFAKLLLKSVMLEIVQEQLTVRPFTFTSEVDKETLWNKLDILTRVANYDYGQTDLDMTSEAGKLWLEFITELSYFSKKSVTTGQAVSSAMFGWAFGRNKNVEVSDVSNELINRLITGVFSDVLFKEIKANVDEGVEALHAKHEKKKGSAVAGFLSSAGLMDSLFGNGSVHKTNETRLRNEAAQLQLQAANVARSQRNTQVQEAYSKKSAELKLSAETCQKIVSVNGAK